MVIPHPSKRNFTHSIITKKDCIDSIFSTFDEDDEENKKKNSPRKFEGERKNLTRSKSRFLFPSAAKSNLTNG